MFDFLKKTQVSKNTEFVPADMAVRMMLIRFLLKRRIENDPISRMLTQGGSSVEDAADADILATQESMLLSLVERYIACRLHGMNPTASCQFIHTRFEASLKLDGIITGPCPQPIDLLGYARFYIGAVQRSGRMPCSISDEHLLDCLGAALNLYPKSIPEA